MGLQDALVMSAVPAPNDVMDKPRRHSAASVKEQGASLEDTLRAMQLHNDNTSTNSNESSHKTNAVNVTSGQQTSSNGADDPLRVDQTANGDDTDGVSLRVDDEDERTEDERGMWSEVDTDDGIRLTKALRFWRPGYVVTPLPRQGHTLRQPVFSARLGRETNIRRTPSNESVDTQLSLFSCSSHGSRKTREKKRRRFRRRRALCDDQTEGKLSLPQKVESPWIQLAKKRRGELDRFMMAHTHALTQGVNLTDESEAFQLCEADEQRALYMCGKLNKMTLAGGVTKSHSTWNINFQHTEAVRHERPACLRRHRVASAGAKTFFGKPIDFQELQKQMMNQRLSALSSHSRARSSWRRTLHRSLSKHSPTSVGSGEVFFSSTGGTPRNVTPPPPSSPAVPEGGSAPSVGAASGSVRCAHTGSEGQREPEKKAETVSVWKGDSQILAIDLKRELTSKVKRRICMTTTALERVTGMGDDNEQRPYTCHLPEFPAFIDQDFALQPKISQKIRISPQLSDVIKSDIRVRMGRPRYHEIRVQDVDMWNRGQTLDRAHRNLKVFNWLHSLKEDEFEAVAVSQNAAGDVRLGLADLATSFGDNFLIRAVDEPEVKPLYQHRKKYI